MAYIGQKPADKALGASDITDGIISNAKLAQDIISAETELATAPADTDEFLISDAGVLKRLDASLVGGGNLEKLASGTFSSNSLSFDGYFTSAYSHYKVILTDVIPSANNGNVSVRFRQSNADVTTSHYNFIAQRGGIQIGTQVNDGSSYAENASLMRLEQGYGTSNVSSASLNSTITFFNPLNTSLYKHIHTQSSFWYNGTTNGATGYWLANTGGGYYHNNTTALSGFTILTESGNITSGNAYLYGVKA